MKVGIITINGNYNFGNRLQNYALLEVLKKMDFNVESIWFYPEKKYFIKKILKKFLPLKKDWKRFNNFSKFTDELLNVKYYNHNKISDKYDFFIAGSDQIWNYNFSTYHNNMFLLFSKKEKNISYAASIGVNDVSKEYINDFKKGLNNFKALSVREERAKEIVEKITNRCDVEVLVDPTMLLTSAEWEKVSKKPKRLKNKKYILTYFLGDLNNKKRKFIEKIANDNGCEIIDLLDKKSEFYECGPREFLYLEKNAFLICTDSFHSAVFAILFEKKFIIFERDDHEEKMNSRIDTLLNKFEIKKKIYKENMNYENLEYDYSKISKILELERKKAITYLKNNIK